MLNRTSRVILLAFGAAGMANAQDKLARQSDVEPPAGQMALPPAAASENDIVIQGYRLRKDIDTTARYPTAISTINIRARYDASERMAKCAARSNLSEYAWLHKVVDGEFNSVRHAYAQDRLARIYATCGEGANALGRQGRDATELEAATAMNGGQKGISPNIEAAPLGHSIYDRGAFTIQALKMFVPDLELTTEQTRDPEVERRFDLREIPRNRFRSPVDQAYYRIAACMVRLQPKLSVQLALGDGPALFGDLQAALIDQARPCVGGAKNVQVDPTQFRIYIADAVYRWAVAARNVASLIPADKG